jgi:proteasome-associated ATPase
VATTRGNSGGSEADEVAELTAQVGFLEEEVSVLRRKLADSPRQVRALEERLAEAQQSLAGASGQNDRLVNTLKEARDQIIALKEEVERLAQPPSGYGVFIGRYDDDSVDIFTGGRKLRVTVSPAVDLKEMRRGQEVMLNEALNVVAALAFERQGDVVQLKEVLEGGDRALVIGHTDEERVVMIAESLLDVPIKAGDSLLLETRSGYVYERIPKSEVSSSKRSPTSTTPTSAGWPRRSSRSATPSSCRSCTRTCSRSTSCDRQRASCCTGLPGAARR